MQGFNRNMHCNDRYRRMLRRRHQRRRGSALKQGGVNRGPAKIARAVFLQHLNHSTTITPGRFCATLDFVAKTAMRSMAQPRVQRSPIVLRMRFNEIVEVD